MTPLAAVNLEPPLAQFAPAASVAEVTLTPFVPFVPLVPLVPGVPAGPVWLQLICVAFFGQGLNGVEPTAVLGQVPVLQTTGVGLVVGADCGVAVARRDDDRDCGDRADGEHAPRRGQ